MANSRKSKNVPMSVMIFLLVVALLFGIAIGFILGHKNEEQTAYEDGIFKTWDDSEVWDNASVDDSPVLWGDTSQWGADEWADTLPWNSDTDFGSSALAVLFDGGSITVDEVLQYYADNEEAYLLQNKTVQDAMYDLARQTVLYQKAKELGCTELSEQDEMEIAQTAQSEYDAMENRPADVTVVSIAETLRESWWLNKLYAVMDEEELPAEQQSLSAEEKRQYIAQTWLENLHTEYYPENLVSSW